MSYAFSRDKSKISGAKALESAVVGRCVAANSRTICPRFHLTISSWPWSHVSPRTAQILYDLVNLAEVIFRFEIECHIGNPDAL